MKKGYVTENFTANISVDEYISRFRDEKRFVEFCKQCPNYGNSEAFGFDMTRTLSELFGIELLWGKNGILPEYLVIVSGLFHNSTENIISEA